MSGTATREPEIIDLNTFRPGDPVRPGESVVQAIARKQQEAREMEHATLERELDAFEQYLDGLPRPPEFTHLPESERRLAEIEAWRTDMEQQEAVRSAPGRPESDSPYSWSKEQRLLTELDRRRRREWLAETETREREDGTATRRNAYDEKTRQIAAKCKRALADADSARVSAIREASECEARELAKLGGRP